MAEEANLQAILATLAQYTQQQQQSAAAQTPQPATNQPAEFNGNFPAAYANINSVAAAQNSTIDNAPVDPRLRGRPQSRSITPGPQSTIDPATITVWQDGLRCVTKIAAQNKTFEASIRRMMQDQRSHEMRWYAERQALKQTQNSRSSSAAKALSILQSLNHGSADSQVEPQSEEAREAELAIFDRKVYAAQCSMEAAMTAELKGLGVPFFGTNAELIVTDDQHAANAGNATSHPKWSGPVSESELAAMKRKMIAHLEMLYRD